MTNHSRVPRSLYEMTSDRMASSLARPPALRITWASPSARPAYWAGSSRASIQVRIAKWRPGGNGKLPLSPNVAAYWAFAASTSSRMLIAFTPCTAFEVVRTCYERQYPSMSMCCQLSVLRVSSGKIGAAVSVCLGGSAVGNLDGTHPTMVSRGGSRQFLALSTATRSRLWYSVSCAVVVAPPYVRQYAEQYMGPG